MTDPRGVLYLNPTAQIGGAERSLLDLAASLDRRRFTPRLVCLGQGPLLAEATRMGVSVEAVPVSEGFERASLRGRRTGALGAGRLDVARGTDADGRSAGGRADGRHDRPQQRQQDASARRAAPAPRHADRLARARLLARSGARATAPARGASLVGRADRQLRGGGRASRTAGRRAAPGPRDCQRNRPAPLRARRAPRRASRRSRVAQERPAGRNGRRTRALEGPGGIPRGGGRRGSTPP